MSFQRQFRLMDLTALQYFARREVEMKLQGDGWSISYHEDLGHTFMVAKKESETRVILLVADKFAKPNAAKLRGQRGTVKQVAKGLGGKPMLGLFWIEEPGPSFELLNALTLSPVA